MSETYAEDTDYDVEDDEFEDEVLEDAIALLKDARRFLMKISRHWSPIRRCKWPPTIATGYCH